MPNVNALCVESPLSGEEVLSTIAAFPQRIAAELTPLLRKLDIETYKNFLVTMYHYTRYAEAQLLHARDLCVKQEMKDYFYQMAREERGHYLLAKKDYEEFGLNVEDSIPPASVKKFQDYWYNLGKKDVNEFVGAMYVFENVAKAVAKEIIDMMQRLDLTRKQSRWLRVHLEADIGHGDEAGDMCRKCVEDNPEAMLEAAAEGADQWMDVFRQAFSNKG